MRFLSVCSGIEAASVAWHPLGWQAQMLSEIEAFPSAALAHHYPDVQNVGDMTRFKEWPDATVDLLVGGTPCQSFSVAGLRKGLADPRGNLCLTYLAIAARYRPRWLVWENVPGVLSSAGGRDFAAFLGGLGELGYGWAYRVLDAQFFGVAQRRRRVFVVASAGGWASAAAVLFERESLRGDLAPRREARKGITEALGRSVAGCLNSAGGHAVPGNSVQDADQGYLIPTIAQTHTRGGQQRLDPETETLIPTIGGDFGVAHALRGEGFDASEDGTGRSTPLVPVHAFDARQSDVIQYGDKTGPLDTDGHTIGIAFDTTQITSKANRSNPKPGDPCHPLAAGAHAPAIATPMQVRRLTPRECERLQGFPDDYTLIPYRGKPAADGPRYKALGNSMAVPVMRWIGERIAMVESIRSAA